MELLATSPRQLHFQDCTAEYRSRYIDGLDSLGSIPGVARFISSPQCPHRLWGPLSLQSNEYRVFFPGVKKQGREADHSPPSSAKVKYGGAIRLRSVVLNCLSTGTTLPFS
jgi:hypothetical protein